MNIKIPFNKPYFTGKEITYIQDAVTRGHISGNGYYTKKCHNYFEKHFGFKKCLLTTSCTDALEMSAILIDIQPGDEVIMPSYTFVSTANAFILRGAKIVFVDSRTDHPGMDELKIEALITSKTRAIVVVHYAGVACDMDKIIEISNKYNLFVIEDAAQSINSYYKDITLGSFGHLATFSFHETKNISSGEGGMLVINDAQFQKRSEIIWEKGTNRAAFFRGEINKYGWVDIGSSYLPSDVIAAILWAQLESLDSINTRRKEIWDTYFKELKSKSVECNIRLPFIPDYATNNAHMFYLVMNSSNERNRFIDYLKSKGVQSVFHYQSLHKSNYYKDKHSNQPLPIADMYSECLVRLPFYYELKSDLQEVIEIIKNGIEHVISVSDFK